MSSRRTRCIFGCDTFGVSMHGFPNRNKYHSVFEAWVSVIPENIAHDDAPLKGQKVCDYHFKPEHRTRGHGLIKTATPCLYLKGVPKVITDLDTEHNYCLPRMKLPVSPANLGITSLSSKTEDTVAQRMYLRRETEGNSWGVRATRPRPAITLSLQDRPRRGRKTHSCLSYYLNNIIHRY